MCETSLISAEAAAVIADWRRERAAAAAMATSHWSAEASSALPSQSETRDAATRPSSRVHIGGLDWEPTLASVVEMLRTAAVLNGTGAV